MLSDEPLILDSGLTPESLKGKYIYLDNDFLSFLSEDFEALEQFVELTIQAHLFIDPLTRFEFLQTVYYPERRREKERFIDNDKIFYHAINHHSNFDKIREDALKLSFVYAHNHSKGASFIDLCLASRVIQQEHALIVTGNRKDFPGVIFDTIGLLSYELKNANPRNFTIVKFNSKKYEDAISRLAKVKDKTK